MPSIVALHIEILFHEKDEEGTATCGYFMYEDHVPPFEKKEKGCVPSSSISKRGALLQALPGVIDNKVLHLQNLALRGAGW